MFHARLAPDRDPSSASVALPEYVIVSPTLNVRFGEGEVIEATGGVLLPPPDERARWCAWMRLTGSA